MKLYCGNCGVEKETKITIFENVDEYLLHCSDCMELLASITYDEAGSFEQFNNERKEDVRVEPEREEEEENYTEEEQEISLEQLIRDINKEEEFKAKVVFTTEDLELLYKLLDVKASRQNSALRKTVSVFDKIEMILQSRECL